MAVEGLAILSDGDVLMVTDNDGVDGSSGETQLINLGRILTAPKASNMLSAGRLHVTATAGRQAGGQQWL